MAHLEPLNYDDILDSEIRSTIKNYEQLRGFVPNSIRTMARRPSLVKAFMQLNQAVLYDGTVPEATKMLISLAVSLATGCRYCQSHMTNLSAIYNVPDEKIAALLGLALPAKLKRPISIYLKSITVRARSSKSSVQHRYLVI